MMAIVVPLCLLRVFSGGVAGFTDGTGIAPGAPRPAELALPFLAAVTPLAGLAVRRFGVLPVLLCGLVVLGLGDVLTAAAGALHGAGAGLAVSATLALATGWPRRLVAGWWVAVLIAALAAAPALGGSRLAARGLLAAQGSGLWLTGVAIVSVVLFASLTDGAGLTGARRPARTTGRVACPSAERAQLGMLAVPAAALGVIAVAMSYRPQAALTAALCGAAGLFALAAHTDRAGAGNGFGVGCAMAGVAVAPVSGTLGVLWTLDGSRASGLLQVAVAVAAVAGALIGAGAAVRGHLRRRGAVQPPDSVGVVAGLLLTAASLISLCLAGPFASPPVLAAAVAAMTGGLAMAVTKPILDVTTAGAMAGAAICVAGILVGCLGAGAIGVHPAGPASIMPPLPGAGEAALRRALVSALGWRELAGAVLAVAIAALKCLRWTATRGPR
jgi:hypothetical protein